MPHSPHKDCRPPPTALTRRRPKCTLTPTGAGKKRQAGHRQKPGRVEHEDSRRYRRGHAGCRLPSVRGERPGRAGGEAAAGDAGQAGADCSAAYGQGL